MRSILKTMLFCWIALFAACEKTGINPETNKESGRSETLNNDEINQEDEAFSKEVITFSNLIPNFEERIYSNNEEGVKKASKDFVDYYLNVHEDNTFNIQITDENIIVNPLDPDPFPMEPCGWNSASCSSSACVETKMEEILGEKRDVVMEFDFSLVNVTIRWNYQDC